LVNIENDHSTEQKILAAAKKVFVLKGMAGARMQDIADEAGINKALLHYYFRNKEKLFEMIFQEAAQRLFPILNRIFSADMPLFEKIEHFCGEYINVVSENPYLPLFVINEINQDPDRFLNKLVGGKGKPDPRPFIAQVEEEINKGCIHPIHPFHLLMNMISMTIFPFVARPMFQRTIGISDTVYKQLMEERKKEIPRFIIASLKK
jgi:TetR/AcrR family transcriptional regulator